MDQHKTTTRKGAESFLALSKFFHETKVKCFDACVVDFQHSDLGAMEKECAKA